MRPQHYNSKNDVIDFVKSHSLNFNEGNIIKYVARARRKDNQLEDLKKAMEYLNREIQHLESNVIVYDSRGGENGGA